MFLALQFVWLSDILLRQLLKLLKLLNGRNFGDSFPILTGGFANLSLAEADDI